MFKYFSISVNCIWIKLFYIEKYGLFRERCLTLGITNRALSIIAVSIANSRWILMS